MGISKGWNICMLLCNLQQCPPLTQDMAVLKHTSELHKWAERDSQPQPGSRVKGSLEVRGK